MRYAVEHSINTQTAATSYANSKLEHTQAIMKHLPNLGASVGANASFGRGIDPATNSYVNTATFNHGVGADFGMTVFNGFTLLNRTRNAKIAKLKGQYDLQRMGDEVAENTMVAYAEVVYNAELVKLSQQRVESYKTDLKRMERMCELGNGSPTDLAQLAATVASEEYTLISRKNSYDISFIKLRDVMNFPLNDTLELANDVEKIEVQKSEQDFSEIEDYAYEILPKNLSNKQALEISKLSLDIAKGGYAPSLAVGGGISTSYFTRLDGAGKASAYGLQLKDNLGEYISVSLSIPIFSNLNRRINVHLAKNNYNLAKSKYEQDKRALASEIKQVLLEVQSTESQYVQAQKNLSAQRYANNANRQKYSSGLLGIIELKTSDNDLLMAQIELRNSYLRHQIKIRQLNYYKGFPYIN